MIIKPLGQKWAQSQLVFGSDDPIWAEAKAILPYSKYIQTAGAGNYRPSIMSTADEQSTSSKIRAAFPGEITIW